MVADNYPMAGPLLSELGQELAAIVGGDPNGIFFYVEIGEGWVRPSLFRAEGEVVRFYPPDDPILSDILFDIWYTEPDITKRWSVIEYVVEDGRFRAEYKFADEVDVTKPDIERRDAALRAHFGNRKIIYPPIEGMAEWQPSPTS